MPNTTQQVSVKTALIVGASRGLGCAIAAEFLKRGWHVIGTVRGYERTQLHDLASEADGRLTIETLDINSADQIAALRARLAGTRIDLLFVNAGTTTRDPVAQIDAVTDAEFLDVMHTNALSPMRVIEALQDLVPDTGLIGAMSSGQGSIGNNEQGMREAYRASKAALNMLLRCFAAREREHPRPMALIAPGWIRTDLGGDKAPYTLEETVPLIVDVLIAKRDRPGIEYLDRFGETVPW
ncbi:SDR family NAD(P)-dependent oxidoreductase [Sphingosinithalassobacter portus]|uniref:SDR family NAD(P)-dependent oxidoreductase n=1 Tax=Stakelama portus TaxID=2676234 RepID=UPI000D6EA5B3|nr:SDR family NAD(P)-dependent oxidoreductase [Sphingosinithalassobacter portus]